MIEIFVKLNFHTFSEQYIFRSHNKFSYEARAMAKATDRVLVCSCARVLVCSCAGVLVCSILFCWYIVNCDFHLLICLFTNLLIQKCFTVWWNWKLGHINTVKLRLTLWNTVFHFFYKCRDCLSMGIIALNIMVYQLYGFSFFTPLIFMLLNSWFLFS
jgi:hypothetical protein